MKKVLIAGCGYVGGELARRLVAKGDYRVFGLRRDAAKLPAGVLPLVADLTDAASLSALPAGLDAVVITVAAGGGGEEAYRRAYDSGLANLLHALVDQGQQLRRLLFTSSTSIYDQADGVEVDESSPTTPQHFTGQIMLRAEKRVSASPYESVILRLGGIYGPGRTRLIEMVRDGRARRTAGSRFTNRNHRDDCAAALEHLLQLPEPQPVYIGCDSEPVEFNDLLGWLAQEMGRPLPPVSGEQPHDSRRYRTNKRCSNRRLVKSGYRFIYPTFREGYRALINSTKGVVG